MSRAYQNVIGAVTWIATEDAELSSLLTAEWESARDPTAKIAVVLASTLNSEQVNAARRKVVDACANESLRGFGYTKGNPERRQIPAIAWQGAILDEVDGSIGEGAGTWFGVCFQSRDLRRLFPDRPGAQISAKGKTGAKPENLAKIAKLEDHRNAAIEQAQAEGREPPPRLTGAEVARHLKIAATTANYNLRTLRRQS